MHAFSQFLVLLASLTGRCITVLLASVTMWRSLVGEGKLSLFLFFVLLLAIKMTQGRLIGRKSNLLCMHEEFA